MAFAVLVALLGSAAVPADASPRGHVATPANQGRHGWSTDGCTNVPDRGWWVHRGVPARFDFHHACVHHDGCYRNHWQTRRGCDDRFRADMGASCRWTHPAHAITRRTCAALARLYHLGVRILGARAYANGSHRVPVVETDESG